ncbi:MAG TPA: hypothetical protein VFU22_02965 [Roseiflexaceae bacterium]|nr:hypothetical protein [Roseiflexaceae bacterium]
MVTRVPQPRHKPLARHGWSRLRLWQRVVVVAAVLAALVIGAELIAYGPRLEAARPTARATPAGAPTSRAMPPLGTDPWFYWGQNRPLHQQP